jgi:lipoprotein NlpI
MKQHIFKTVSLLLLSLTISGNLSWADSVPRMTDTDKCTKKPDAKVDGTIYLLREKMQQQLKAYNDARFKMSDVLRAMVIDYSLQGYSKKRILSYAKHFEEMSNSIPNLDPDTAEYKNFDFRLGMSFASTVIFLNSTDDVLKYFQSDQKNPKSNISKYVIEMDMEGEAYTSLLNELRKKDAASCT